MKVMYRNLKPLDSEFLAATNDIAITLDVFLARGCHKPVLFTAVPKG
jgi:hypothetical protein